MKKIIVLTFYVFFLCSCQSDVSHFVIHEKNIKNMCILMDQHPTLSARLAATEFRFHFKKITGTEIPVIHGDLPEGIRQLFVLRLSGGQEQQITKLNIGYAAMWPHLQPKTLKP